MANQYLIAVKRLGIRAAGAFLLTSVGCAFPHGQYGGDPALGNWNRPIAPTPPVWSGGDPGHSPAYDGATHLGVNADVPANWDRNRQYIVPTYPGGLNLFRGFGGGSGAGVPPEGLGPADQGNQTSTGKPSKAAGATLPELTSSPQSLALAKAYGSPASANSVTFRTPEHGAMLTSGASIDQNVPVRKKKVAPIDLTKEPSSIASVEEGQTLLTSCGARLQRMEQQPTGEWQFSCVAGANGDERRYEAKNGDQLEAVRAVMVQIQNDR